MYGYVQLEIHEAESFLRTQEVANFSRNSSHFMKPEGFIFYRIHKSPPPLRILSQINIVHAPPPTS
jgi:hypothetical protein